MTLGLTSEGLPVDHLARLVELHEVSVPVDESVTTAQAAVIIEACRRSAESWAAGVGASIGVMTTFGGEGQLMPDPGMSAIGVRFELVVGQGGADEEMSWAWSPRWAHWLRALRCVANPRPRLADDDSPDGPNAAVFEIFSGARI